MAPNHLKIKNPIETDLIHSISFHFHSTEEATSSVEIDSATESNASTVLRATDATPNSESYVSTSETSEPPASKAQVLEELKARIRELEGSPHYKCFICKVRCRF